jgi:hypothetical protein
MGQGPRIDPEDIAYCLLGICGVSITPMINLMLLFSEVPNGNDSLRKTFGRQLCRWTSSPKERHARSKIGY